MCQSEAHGCVVRPAEDERRVTRRSGPRRLPRNRSYRQGGHNTEQREGDLHRVATENVLPSWLVHLSTTIDLTTSLRTLFRLHCHERVFSCNATPHALPRNDRRISTVLSWRDRSHYAPDCRQDCDFLQNPGARRTQVTVWIPAMLVTKANVMLLVQCVWKRDGPSWKQVSRISQRTSDEGVCEPAAVVCVVVLRFFTPTTRAVDVMYLSSW